MSVSSAKPDRKIIFAVNLPLKLFGATVANADTVSLWLVNVQSLAIRSLIKKKCLYHMPVKFEQNRMVQTTRNFELFDKKKKKTGF